MPAAKRPSSSSKRPGGPARRGGSGGPTRGKGGPKKPGTSGPRRAGAAGSTRAGGPRGTGRPRGSGTGSASSSRGPRTGSSSSGRPGSAGRSGSSNGGRSASGSRSGASSGGRSGPSNRPGRPKRSGPSGRSSDDRREGTGAPGAARRSSRPPAGGSRGGRSSGPGRGDRRPTERRDERSGDDIPNIPGQGALTRKGAGWLKKVDALDKAGVKRPPRGGASDAWRRAAGLDDDGERPAKPLRRTSKEREPGHAGLAARALGEDDELVIVDDESVRSEASRAVSRGGRPSPTADDDLTLEDEVRAELAKAVPRPKVARTEARLADAARAFRRDRFADAARILRPLADEAPTVAPVRELYGVTLYRQGKWRPAAKELEAFRLLSGSSEQNPVLADCYRALHRWDAVDDLWEDLRQASPSADVVVEGRIVTAGALADQDRLPAAIALLEQGWKRPKRPLVHHLRRGYALADLYERAGEVARARELFAWVAAHDEGETDADGRVRSLR